MCFLNRLVTLDQLSFYEAYVIYCFKVGYLICTYNHAVRLALMKNFEFLITFQVIFPLPAESWSMVYLYVGVGVEPLWYEAQQRTPILALTINLQREIEILSTMFPLAISSTV